jgi:hypothetical protein
MANHYDQALEFLVQDDLKKEQQSKVGPSKEETKAEKARKEAAKQVIIQRMEQNGWTYIQHRGRFLHLCTKVKHKPLNPKVAASLYFQFEGREVPRLRAEGKLPNIPRNEDAATRDVRFKQQTMAFYKYIEAILISKGIKVKDLKISKKKPTGELVYTLEEL